MTLEKWLSESNVSVSSLADECGVTRQTVYLWINGSSRPRLELIDKISKITRGVVGWKEWVSKESKTPRAMEG